jgi:hypothetical protein
LVYYGGPWTGKCWCIFCPFWISYDHLGKFVVIRYISFRFDLLFHEKSGNPDGNNFWGRSVLQFLKCWVLLPTQSRFISIQKLGTDVMIFKIFSQKLAFFTQNKAKSCKNLITTLLFFAENCWKSQKILIICNIGPRLGKK